MSHWIIHSKDSFKTLIHSGTKQGMSEELNHSLNRSDQKHWFISEQNKKWVSIWIIHSTHSWKTLVYSVVFMSDSLSHSFIWFVQNTDIFKKKPWLIRRLPVLLWDAQQVIHPWLWLHLFTLANQTGNIVSKMLNMNFLLLNFWFESKTASLRVWYCCG